VIYTDEQKAKRKAATARWRARNPEHAAALSRAYDEAPARKAQKRTLYAAWYTENKADSIARVVARYKADVPAHNAKVRERYHRDLEKSRARGRAAYAKNPEPAKLAATRRRARKAGAVGDLTVAEWHKIQAQYAGRCAYCFKQCKTTKDHVVPLVLGGKHAASNIAPACFSCNASKSSTPLLDWLWRKDAPRRRRVQTEIGEGVVITTEA